MQKPFPIDAVIAWVDGDDPSHRSRRARYVTADAEMKRPDIGGEERFKAQGEIFFAVGTLLRFAPFVRKIFIVTDGQNPGVDAFVARNFPGRENSIVIVDHKDIFKDYEQYLPVFNSLSIETMLWRIPGLAEHYVYLNDDFFIASPLSESDWFDERGKMMCYARPFSAAVARLLRAVKPRRNGRRVFGFKDAMLNASDLLGRKSFPYIGHTPLPQRKSILADFFIARQDALISNISHRFRHPSQFNPQVLCYMLGAAAGECLMVSRSRNTLFIKPAEGRAGYVEKKLAGADDYEAVKFGCVNSFDRATPDEQMLFRQWLTRRSGIDFINITD